MSFNFLAQGRNEAKENLENTLKEMLPWIKINGQHLYSIKLTFCKYILHKEN